MTNTSVQQALENIYASLHNDNEGIDPAIAALKKAMGAEKTVEVDPARLMDASRAGRRMMQSYFKRQGVIVTFASGS